MLGIERARGRKPFDGLDELDWWTFVCAGCGRTTWIGREQSQTLAEFERAVRWIHGVPAVCSDCQRETRLF